MECKTHLSLVSAINQDICYFISKSFFFFKKENTMTIILIGNDHCHIVLNNNNHISLMLRMWLCFFWGVFQ